MKNSTKVALGFLIAVLLVLAFMFFTNPVKHCEWSGGEWYPPGDTEHKCLYQ